MRPENQKMQAFLLSHGIRATPKYLFTGSLKGRWRLYNKDTPWSMDLANQLNSLGFTDFNGRPLDRFSGNGGLFCAFVFGHNEFLT